MIKELVKHAKQLLFDDSVAKTGSNNVQGAIDKNSGDIEKNSDDIRANKTIVGNIARFMGIMSTDMKSYEGANNLINGGIDAPNATSVLRVLYTATTDTLVNVSGYATFPAGGNVGNMVSNLLIDSKPVYAVNNYNNQLMNFPITGTFRLSAGQKLNLQVHQTSGQTKTVNYSVGIKAIDISNL